MTAAGWAEAIGATLDDKGVPTAASIAAHLRSAMRAAGMLRRSQITRGLTEAYAPFGIESSALRSAIDEALQSLLLIGDLTELSSAGGSAYLLTPPRLVVVNAECAVLLGASDLEPGNPQVCRRLSAPEWPAEDEVIRVDLHSELGLPDWRIHLVELGGVDVPRGSAAGLFDHVARLSTGGDRLADLSSDRVRVLAGRQTYFGRYDAAQPEGRWRPAGPDGLFCAVRHAGYQWRPSVVTIENGHASLWEADNWDLWRWAVVGQTLSEGGSVYAINADTAEFVAHVPMPRQLRRLFALGAEAAGPWRWRCAPELAAAADELLVGATY